MSEVAVVNPRMQTVRRIKKVRLTRLSTRLALGVGLPTILAAIYFAAIATPRYESVSIFTVQSADGSAPSQIELLVSAVPGNSAGRDALLVQQYVLSRDMLQWLIQKHGFVQHYSDPSIDFGSRLGASAPLEDRYEYYLDHVEVDHDTQSGALTLRVQAFSSEKAQGLARAILERSEKMVNEMMRKARGDRIDLARREVNAAEERLGQARQKLVKLQSERSELNPAASAEALYGLRTSLEAELAQARAELSALRANLQPNAPQLVSARQRVAALAQQVNQQNKRLAGDGSEGLSQHIAEFEPAVMEKEFAEKAHLSALKSLELARLEADRQHRYLVTISNPSRPEEPTHPRVWIAIVTVLVLSFALVTIGALIFASVREHATI